MKRTLQLLALAALLLTPVAASAQFGNLGNRLKQKAKQKIESKVNQTVNNPRDVVETVASMTPEKSDAQSKVQASVGGFTYEINGRINHEKWNKTQNSTITFTGIPATIADFRTLQSTLGKEPQGAVALQVMAFEMYRRDPNLGRQALELNNTSTNLTSTLRQLKEVMNVEDASYARPYLAAALMAGAKNTNAYTPDFPYKIKVRVNPVTKYQDSELLDGTVIYLQIDSEGWDTNWRGVEVVRPDGTDHFVISNCPAMYTQPKKIKGSWPGLK